jgi:hypothetical protein
MATTPKVLYEGQLPNSKTTLFTSVGTTLVNFASFLNTNTTTETVRIYVKRGTSREIIHQDLLQWASVRDMELGKLTLENGDLIEGQTTTAAKVDTWISGFVVV